MFLCQRTVLVFIACISATLLYARAQTPPSVTSVQPTTLYTNLVAKLTITGEAFTTQNTVTICDADTVMTCTACDKAHSLPIGSQEVTPTQIVLDEIDTGDTAFDLRVCLAVPGQDPLQVGSNTMLIYDDPKVQRMEPSVLQGGSHAVETSLDIYGIGFKPLQQVYLHYPEGDYPCANDENSPGIVATEFVKVSDTQLHFDSVKATSGSGKLYLCVGFHRMPKGGDVLYVIAFSGLTVNNPDAPKPGGLSTGAWIGIGFGIAGGVAIIIILVIVVVVRRRRSRVATTYDTLDHLQYATGKIAPGTPPPPSAPPFAYQPPPSGVPPYSYQQPPSGGAPTFAYQQPGRL